MERRRNLFSFAEEYARRFLFLAVVEENLENVLLPRERQTSWDRRIKAGRAYFDEGLPLVQIGQRFGWKGTEYARQMKDDYVKKLHQKASPSLQNEFPSDNIPRSRAGEEIQQQKALQRFDSANSRLAVAVEAMHQGKTPKEVHASMGEQAPVQLRSLRKNLARYGVDLPPLYREVRYNTDLIARIKSTDDYDETRALFSYVNKGTYTRTSKESYPALVTVSEVAKRAGFYLAKAHIDEFVASLAAVGMPVLKLPAGTVKNTTSYDLLSTRHADEAEQLFLMDETLKKYRENPVKQIFGPSTDKIPTTTQASHSEEYQHLSNFFRSINIAMPRNKSIESLGMFDDNCPVSIFRWGRNVCYPKDQEEALKSYILARF